MSLNIRTTEFDAKDSMFSYIYMIITNREKRD